MKEKSLGFKRTEFCGEVSALGFKVYFVLICSISFLYDILGLLFPSGDNSFSNAARN
jgi:hypothetical protein